MAELVSTRDPEAVPVSYNHSIIEGLASDKGLYTPEGAKYPQVSQEELTEMLDITYAQMATIIKGKLIGDDISPFDQYALNKIAYDPEAFPAAKQGNIAPVVEVADNLSVQKLHLGPTGVFKDLPLRVVMQEINFELDISDKHIVILGASSGDTFSAAERAARDAAAGRARRIAMFMLTPRNGAMTAFQRAQGGIESDRYTHNLSYDGSFDDCQDIVKLLKQDEEFKDLGAVNSINWGRITAQVVYSFWGYLNMVRDGQIKMGDQIDTITPTGNVGNVLSSHIAKRMGLPIRESVIATNENDVMHRLVQTGIYDKPDKPHDTSSPSMDITAASNYERLAYEFFEADAVWTRAYMEEFEAKGRVDLKDYGLSADVFKDAAIDSGSSTHADRVEAIRSVYSSSGEIIDPHTADAVSVAMKRERDIPALCYGTADQVKFEAVTREALGFVPPREERFRDLESQPGADNFVLVDSVDAVKAYIRKHRP